MTQSFLVKYHPGAKYSAGDVFLLHWRLWWGSVCIRFGYDSNKDEMVKEAPTCLVLD